MIFIVNSQGTTIGVESSDVYQGAVIPNGLAVIAPFPNNVIPTVSFTLPNGLSIPGGIMNRIPLTSQMQDNNGFSFNAWGYDLDIPITQFPGTVKVQFTFATGHGTITSYPTQFEVQRGVLIDAPTFDVVENVQQVITDITSYLASIGANTFEALENAIEYVQYITPDNYLLNDNAHRAELTFIGGTVDVSGDNTIAGMTDNLTEADILNPMGDSYFYKYSGTESNVGFQVSFPTPFNVGLVQLYLYEITEATTLTIQCGNVSKTVDVAPIQYYDDVLTSKMRIIRVHIDTRADTVTITQSVGNSLIYKGVEIFEVSTEGYYKIVQADGNTFEMSTFNPEEMLALLESAKSQAQASAESAQKWAEGTTVTTDPQYKHSAKDYAESITELAGEVGGYPILENIDGSPKIPSTYINQVQIHNNIEITSESQLATIDAQPGDVAYLVDTIDGVKTITKSWLLLSIDNGTRNWARYGASYADNAGNAVYAASAGDALKVNGVTYKKVPQSVYNTLTSVQKQGVYFVTLGE